MPMQAVTPSRRPSSRVQSLAQLIRLSSRVQSLAQLIRLGRQSLLRPWAWRTAPARSVRWVACIPTG